MDGVFRANLPTHLPLLRSFSGTGQEISFFFYLMTCLAENSGSNLTGSSFGK